VLDPALEPLSLPVPSPPPIALSQRLGALIEVVLCSGFPTQIIIIAVLTSLGVRPLTATGAWSPSFIVTLSMVDTVVVIALILMFLSAHGERARDVLLGQRPAWPEVKRGIALLPLIFLAAALLLTIVRLIAPQLRNVPENPFTSMLQNRRDAVTFGIVAMIAGGVREEIQRGFILHRFRHYLGGGAVGVILHSLIFGLGHIDQGKDAMISVAALGAIWGTVYLIRGSVVAPMVSHAGFNLSQIVLSQIVKVASLR
jgi:membrane protease YdiL (CAAX protease family)